ncbi:MAG TPA: hypothetical protein VFS48_07450 [Solirubrobacterales bacterium]|nr:hypothetical protein [Solirubrobacterales bacterium]
MDKLSSSPKARIASFALALGLAFVLAFALGSAFDPAETGAGAEHGGATHAEPAAAHHQGTGEADGHSDQPATAAATAGLSVAEGGYSLRLEPAFLEAGEARELRFRIVDVGGAAVADFDRLHEREMHLIVVRRDGAHFQHLHPDMDAAGTWTVALSLPAAGVYRVFADFSVAGAPHTLATDLFAPGRFDPRPFPAITPVDAVAGYEVRLAGATLTAGQPATLRFLVTRAGGEVAGIESHLGAKGHLVALREGDLAFLHAHPDEGAAPNVIPYSATFPTAGRYRLFLQFKHAGQVRTAQFTVAVAR